MTTQPEKTIAPADDKIPVITFGGKDWPVPTLAPKQNRIVIPLLLEMMPKIVDATKDGGQAMFSALSKYLTQENYDKLVIIVFNAVQRGTPEMTEEEFSNLPIPTMELITSLTLIARQAGLFLPPSALVKLKPKD